MTNLLKKLIVINNLIQTSYPQALSKLIHIIGDINVAEDMLQDAVTKALVEWPKSTPKNAVAWLVQVARNGFIDQYRRDKKQDKSTLLSEPTFSPNLDEHALLMSYNDDLLRLIFTCCHPSLNIETQLLLTLKHVLGLSVSEISNALLKPDKTIEQRLTRAKRKISAAKILYYIPDQKEWPQRLKSVLKVIYLFFNEGYFTTSSEQLINIKVCRDAIRLARLVHACIKENPEVIGLLALLLHQYARTPARCDKNGGLILLGFQDRTLWLKDEINEANILVEKSLFIGGGTNYAIQAAIAALHNNANTTEETDWRQIYALYQALIRIDNNPVIKLNAAVALAKFDKIESAIKEIKLLSSSLSKYSHYHSALAALYKEAQQYQTAIKHYKQALVYTKNTVEINFIRQQIVLCDK